MTEAANRIPPRPTPKGDTARKPKPGKSVATRAKAAANDAGSRVIAEVEGNPLATLAAGIAVGLVAGALLPKTKVEGKYLGAFGAALNDSALLAAKAARDAGTAELAAIGISKVGANEQVTKLFEGIGGALRTAGEAARDSRKTAPAKTTRARKPAASKTTKA